MTVTAGVDSVGSYFGMREVALGKDSKGTTICLQTSRVKFQRLLVAVFLFCESLS